MSSKNRHYNYANDARTHRCGLMRCSVCNKPIEAGAFRYYEKRDAYVTQHRACCEEDAMWAKIDAAAAAGAAKQKARSDACRAFKAQWGVDELDEYIIDEAVA